MVSPKVTRTNEHLVSRGLQWNFANEDSRVALLDTKTCRIVNDRKAIRSNFSRSGFTLCELPNGDLSDWLDREFKKIESDVLPEIRKVWPHNAGPRQRAAVAQLFALHLVRSEAFSTRYDGIMDDLRRYELPRLAGHPDAIAAFVSAKRRPPRPGEIEAELERSLSDVQASKRWLSGGMARQYNQIAQTLNGWSMQVLWSRAPQPGFILGDVPVVLARTANETYGFRDEVALHEADVISGPLSRRVAVCFTSTPLSHVELNSEGVRLFNSQSWKAALSFVACHPADTTATLRMAGRIDEYPARRLHEQEPNQPPSYVRRPFRLP